MEMNLLIHCINFFTTAGKKVKFFHHRALARDVIHDVTDGRRHVGGIFSHRTGRLNGNNVRKWPIETLMSKPRFDLMHWDVSIGTDKWPYFQPFSNVISIETSRDAQIKYLQYGGRPSMTSSRDVTASPL
jgi:hypothetical protein